MTQNRRFAQSARRALLLLALAENFVWGTVFINHYVGVPLLVLCAHVAYSVSSLASLVCLVLFLFSHGKPTVKRGKDLDAYRKNRLYWVDAGYIISSGVQLLCAPWIFRPSLDSLSFVHSPPFTLFGIDFFVPCSIILPILFVWQQHKLYRTGYFRFHKQRDTVKSILTGENKDAPAHNIILAVIHNETSDYFSSFSSVPRYNRAFNLCALDWEQDVKSYKRLTPEGEAHLLELIQFVLYLVPAATPQEAQHKLKDIWEQIRQLGEFQPQVRLAVAFVSDESYSVDIPPELGYVAQLDLLTVRRPQDVSLEELAAQRYWVPKDMARALKQQGDGGDISTLTQYAHGQELRDLVLAANYAYQQLPGALLRLLTPQGAGQTQDWDPLFTEFFRGAVQLTPCLPSFMALMDLTDMILRLTLYTLYMSREIPVPWGKDSVPDNYRELGQALVDTVCETDVIYYGVQALDVPCRLPQVLRKIEEQLQVEFQGNAYSCQGLCKALYYVRNKTKGHGSVQDETAGLFWSFILEAVLVLGQMLCLERFRIQLKGERVLAGWDGQLVDLGDFAHCAGDHPVVALDAKKENRPVNIDYFRGTLVVPSVTKSVTEQQPVTNGLQP